MSSRPLWAAAQVVEFRTAGAALPFIALRPRCSYIFESVQSALLFFGWPDGAPWELRIASLQWTIPAWLPLGLLADITRALLPPSDESESMFTIVLEVHQSRRSDPAPILYDTRELFFQSIKQSLFLRTGSASGAVCMPLQEQSILWNAVAEGNDVAIRDSLFKLSMYAGVAAPDSATLGNADFLHVSLAASVLRPDGLRASAAAAEIAGLRSVPVRLLILAPAAPGGASGEVPVGPAEVATAAAPFFRLVQRKVGPGLTLGAALASLLPRETWPLALADYEARGQADAGVEPSPPPVAHAPAAGACRLLLHGLDVCTPAPPPPMLPPTPAPAASASASSAPRRRRSRGPSLTAAEGGVTYVFHPLGSPEGSGDSEDGGLASPPLGAGKGPRSPSGASAAPSLESPLGCAVASAAVPDPYAPGHRLQPMGPVDLLRVTRAVSAGELSGVSYATASAESARSDSSRPASASGAPGEGLLLVGQSPDPLVVAPPLQDSEELLQPAFVVEPPCVSDSTSAALPGSAKAALKAQQPPPLLCAAVAQLWQELRYPDGWLYVLIAP